MTSFTCHVLQYVYKDIVFIEELEVLLDKYVILLFSFKRNVQKHRIIWTLKIGSAKKKPNVSTRKSN